MKTELGAALPVMYAAMRTATHTKQRLPNILTSDKIGKVERSVYVLQHAPAIAAPNEDPEYCRATSERPTSQSPALRRLGVLHWR